MELLLVREEHSLMPEWFFPSCWLRTVDGLMSVFGTPSEERPSQCFSSGSGNRSLKVRARFLGMLASGTRRDMISTRVVGVLPERRIRSGRFSQNSGHGQRADERVPHFRSQKPFLAFPVPTCVLPFERGVPHFPSVFLAVV
jgi:hypothetical protein